MEEKSGVTEFVWEKTTIYFSEQLGFNRKPIKFPTRVRARAHANHAINDAQKGCAMQLNGITLSPNSDENEISLYIYQYLLKHSRE